MSTVARESTARGSRHARLVRVTHWINVLSFVALTISGIGILLAHPRFYWGETGYFDMPAAFELPLTVNKHHTWWGTPGSEGKEASGIMRFRSSPRQRAESLAIAGGSSPS